MKRNEFYIDVLLEKENISDVYSAITESEWDDEEKKYMNRTIVDLMNDRAIIKWDNCLRSYVDEHALTLQQLEDMKEKFEKRFEHFNEMEEKVKNEIETLDPDAPEDIKKGLELQRKFAEVQKTISKN